jgi:peptide/nickel transport system substrate-binding protein/oligopeptide transport system substrate-binding protein
MFLSACSSNTPSNQSTTTKAPDSQQVFHYPTEVEADFQTLDPALVQSLGDGYAIQMIFTGLVQFDNNGNLKDQLAQSHEVSKDGLTYTFHLRPNLKFSDGAPLTANDVAYSINRALLPATNSQVAYYLKLIKGYADITSGKVSTLIGTSLIVKDAKTISIVISQPAAYFLDALTYPISYVVEKSLLTKYGTNWTDHLTEGGGDGPFKVKSYVHGKTFNVVPNPNYYGQQSALKEIDMPFSGDQETTYKAYKNHQYDWAIVPGADVPEARKRPDFYKGPLLNIRYISFNFLAKPFNNLNIRKAFALAINKEILANDIANGSATATNHIVPQGMYGYHANLKGPDGTTNLTGNPTLAQQLLAQGMREEGYNSINNLPSLTLSSFTGNNTFNNIVNEVASEWKTVLKVNVKVNLIDFNRLSQEMNATTGNDSLQMWAYGWQADYPDPQDWLTVFFGTGQGNNNYGDKRNNAPEQLVTQSQLSKADAEQNSAKRLSLYNDAEQQLINAVAWLPLYQPAIPIVQNPKLHGYKTNTLQITDPDSWHDIYFTT